MIGLDTNLLLRLIAQDDRAQTEAATELLQSIEEAGEVAWINRIVLCETLWVLERHFSYRREELAAVVFRLLQTQNLQLENDAEVAEALEWYEQSNVGFSDCLIAAGNRRQGVSETMTFDKKAAKVDGFTLLA